MAITWDTQITKVNNPRIDVTFTREDSESPNDTFTKSYKNVMAASAAERAAILNDVWDDWQIELTNRGELAEFLSNLEQSANTNLMAREV